MARGNSKVTPTNKSQNRNDLRARKMETKTSGIPKPNKRKPKNVDTDCTPRTKQDNTGQSDSGKNPASVFLTQDPHEEDMTADVDETPKVLENTEMDDNGITQNVGIAQNRNLDTSSPDRTVTKYSTDSGVADVEPTLLHPTKDPAEDTTISSRSQSGVPPGRSQTETPAAPGHGATLPNPAVGDETCTARGVTEPVPTVGPRGLSDLKAGIRKEYDQGLDNLRKMISDIEKELEEAALEFYSCDENDEDKYEEYLRKTNDRFLMCNNFLRKKQVNLEVIDSEIKILSLLNKLRELHSDVDQDLIHYITGFYEHLKTNLNKIHMIGVRYRNTVLKILQSSCTSYYSNDTASLDVSVIYREEVKSFVSEIFVTLEYLDLLVKSYQNCTKQELFTNTNFSERVLICCDQKAFPILRIIPDIGEKISHVCQLSKQWIDKDQIYIHDINNHIRQRRNQTRRKEQDLRKQEEELDTKSKSVLEAYELFNANKKELQKLEKRLQVVEKRMEQCTRSKTYKEEERRQKEGMVGFLEISITQTKKNTSLQLKRNRLQRQIRELEESIQQMEQELSQVQNDLICMQKERHAVEGKVEKSNTTYVSLKTELDQFSRHVKAVQKDMVELNNSLMELEIIQNFKTSPEKVDDFYERPSSVKLAPSLKEKIKQRWKKRHNSKAKLS